MSSRLKVLDVLYQSNDAYASVTAISMVSLLENNKHIEKLNIYYLNYGIKNSNVKKLNSIVRRYSNAQLHMINAVKYHDELIKLGVKSWRGIYVTWLKMLAFADIPVESGKLLFLNGQTVVNGSLDELTEIEFESSIMALAYDCLLVDHKLSLGLSMEDGYYNCGIMLINHTKWAEENIGEYVKDCLKQKSDYLIVDQDFCNSVFKGQIMPLSVTYNFTSAFYGYGVDGLIKAGRLNEGPFYSQEEIMQAYYSPKIIHSLLGVTGKPWELDNKHPNKYLWRKYIKKIPWLEEDFATASHTANWLLYELLPRFMYMKLYRLGVDMKYGVNRRSKFLVGILNKITAQKGT